MKSHTWLLWVLAFLLTAASAVYQKRSGPTYPVKGVVDVGGQEVAFKLPRSHAGPGDAEIRLPDVDPLLSGTLEFRRYRSNDEWQRVALECTGDGFVGHIPHQPAAGKVMYRLYLTTAPGSRVALTAEPVIIRFRGSVPAAVLVAHIVFIFAGMLLSTRTGLEALRKGPRTYALAVLTLSCLVIGGLILGPVVQKYAFGAFWTGWPFGHDLTDNKLAVAVLFWAVALWRVGRKRTARGWVLAAAVVTLAVWLIPHSVLGSELDYTQAPQ